MLGLFDAFVGQQLLTGPSYAGANCADGAFHRLGRLFVGKPYELGENECSASILIEYVEELVDLNPEMIVMIGGHEVGDESLVELATSDFTTRRISANPACDRQQPGTGGTIASEPVDRSQSTGIGLLGEVFGIGRSSQIATNAEHVGQGLGNEVIQSRAVACLGAQCCDRQSIHSPSVPRRELKAKLMRQYRYMNCETAQAAVSASIDGDHDVAAAVDVHLNECDECRQWQERAYRLRRATLRSAVDGGDLEIEGVPSRAGLYRWVRFALAWAGVLLVLWNVVDMFAAGSGSAIHLERHQAAFGVALGLAFLFVAWRPDRAYGMVPFAATFTLALSLSAIIDLVNGASTLLRESAHLVELVGLALLWVLGVEAGPGRRSRPVDT